MTHSPDSLPPRPDADPFPFTPAPVRARHDGWTPERQRAFIAALARLGVVSAAARHVGRSPKSAYALRDRPDAGSFAVAWGRAQAAGLDRARDIALERAVEGTVIPIFYRGRQVGERRVVNDSLVIAALRLTLRERPGATDPGPEFTGL